MKVKVLNLLDYDYGNVMSTFVFKEEANITEINDIVSEMFEEEQGSRPYCDIITELYGHLMLDVIERQEIDW